MSTEFTTKDVEDRAKEIAIEALYDDETGIFEDYIKSEESEDIAQPLMAALKALSSKRSWNNSGWMYEALRHLEEVRKIIESEQKRDFPCFVDQAREEFMNEDV
jgi:hypothetical protein